MKATSFVFTGLQKPLTMFGLPAWLLGALAAVSAVSMVLLIVAGFYAISLPAAVVVFAVGWYKLWQRVRADHHFGNIVLALPRFWLRRGRQARGKAHLMAGHPPRPGKGGRTHIRLPISPAAPVVTPDRGAG